MAQTYTSKNTSINSTKLPMVYTNKRAMNIFVGKKVIDIGGGKFDNAIEYCKTLDTELAVYDKYNRDKAHNFRVLAKKYDVAIISNVLNVIDDKEARFEVLRLAEHKAKTILITVYEGDGTGIGRPTKDDCYQLNRKTADYMEEIAEALPKYTIKRYGKLMVATTK